MTIAGDTADLVSTDLWGESVTVVRNTPTYGGDGAGADSWASVGTANADVQPADSAAAGQVLTGDLGQVRLSTHTVFMIPTVDVRIGDRIRRSGWSTGDDELHVDFVSTFEDHLEVLTHFVKGHA